MSDADANLWDSPTHALEYAIGNGVSLALLAVTKPGAPD
jgi:hypothetical protein